MLSCNSYDCALGAKSSMPSDKACVDPNYYCPAGSRIAVPEGARAVPNARGVYISFALCLPGRYCVGGLERLCPAVRAATWAAAVEKRAGADQRVPECVHRVVMERQQAWRPLIVPACAHRATCVRLVLLPASRLPVHPMAPSTVTRRLTGNLQ